MIEFVDFKKQKRLQPAQIENVSGLKNNGQRGHDVFAIGLAAQPHGHDESVADEAENEDHFGRVE